MCVYVCVCVCVYVCVCVCVCVCSRVYYVRMWGCARVNILIQQHRTDPIQSSKLEGLWQWTWITNLKFSALLVSHWGWWQHLGKKGGRRRRRSCEREGKCIAPFWPCLCVLQLINTAISPSTHARTHGPVSLNRIEELRRGRLGHTLYNCWPSDYSV